MFEDNWATFAASYKAHFRLKSTFASAHSLCHIFAKTGPVTFQYTWATFAETYVHHIWFTPWLAFVDCATFLPMVDHIWLALFGPYLLFTTWAPLGSHSVYTLPWTPHLCLQRLTCDLIHLGHFCYFTFGPLQAYIHFVWAIRRPAVPYHCLKWPTSACYLGFSFVFICFMIKMTNTIKNTIK